MAKYSDIKGFTVQTLSTDTVASQFAGGSWASGGDLNTARRILAGAGIQTADVNFRFLPCLVAGLAYYVAMKDPELVTRLPRLKAAYEEAFELAAGEDREKATISLIPRLFGTN